LVFWENEWRWPMTKYSRIAGWGKYAPEKVLTNQDLEKMVDTSDKWIVTRTGIRERRIAAPEETTATMSVEAGRAALDKAQLRPTDLDLIIVATSSPDHFLPPVSSMVQDMLGAKGVAAFTLVAGCTGFVYALATAHQFIANGTYENVLVIGAELISRFVDWEDRSTCVLFGDGAGAVVLTASDRPGGVLSFVLGSDGSLADALIVPASGSKEPFSQKVLDERTHYIRMDGRRVLRFAIRIMSKAAVEAVKASGLSLSDIDLLIPHQANLRIIELARRHLGLPEEKVFINVDRYGNTSAASIPIALCEAIEEGRVNEGDNVVMVGFGGGLTWAATVVHMGVMETLPRLVVWRFVPVGSLPLEEMKVMARATMDSLALQASALLLPLYSKTGLRRRK
jgi:3-oxoacyl-[acyl-carrier-protein] synthase-3